MFTINLIKDKVVLPSEKRSFILYFQIIAGVSIFLFVILFLRFIIISSITGKYAKQRYTLESQINDFQSNSELSVLATSGANYIAQTKSIEAMLNERILYTKRFQELSSILPNRMLVTKINLDTINQRMNLEVAVSIKSAEEDLGSVRQFIEALDNSVFWGPGTKLESQETVQISGGETNLFRITVPIEKKIKENG